MPVFKKASCIVATTHEASLILNFGSALSPIEPLLEDRWVTSELLGNLPIGNPFDHEIQVVFGGKGQPGIDKAAAGGAVLVLKQEEGELDPPDSPQLAGDKGVTVAAGADIVDCQLETQLAQTSDLVVQVGQAVYRFTALGQLNGDLVTVLLVDRGQKVPDIVKTQLTGLNVDVDLAVWVAVQDVVQGGLADGDPSLVPRSGCQAGRKVDSRKGIRGVTHQHLIGIDGGVELLVDPENWLKNIM